MQTKHWRIGYSTWKHGWVFNIYVLLVSGFDGSSFRILATLIGLYEMRCWVWSVYFVTLIGLHKSEFFKTRLQIQFSTFHIRNYYYIQIDLILRHIIQTRLSQAVFLEKVNFMTPRFIALPWFSCYLSSTFQMVFAQIKMF